MAWIAAGFLQSCATIMIVALLLLLVHDLRYCAVCAGSLLVLMLLDSCC
jgi:hypothetical protein